MKDSRVVLIRRRRIRRNRARIVVLSGVLVLVFSTFTFLGVRASSRAFAGSKESSALGTNIEQPPMGEHLQRKRPY